RSTYNHLSSWLTDARNLTNPNTVIFLIGNKCDLEAQRDVTYEEAKQFADENGLMFVEASAKTGQHVEEAFLETAKKIYQNIQDGSLDLNAAESGVQHKPQSRTTANLMSDATADKEACGYIPYRRNTSLVASSPRKKKCRDSETAAGSYLRAFLQESTSDHRTRTRPCPPSRQCYDAWNASLTGMFGVPSRPGPVEPPGTWRRQHDASATRSGGSREAAFEDAVNAPVGDASQEPQWRRRPPFETRR
ncbi:hypothetical protein HPB47_011047, partial [Ixodes persulcatus]